MNKNSQIKIKFFSQKLIAEIGSGNIKRKLIPSNEEVYPEIINELSLYQYKKYLGSLRCLIDTENMEGIVYMGY